MIYVARLTLKNFNIFMLPVFMSYSLTVVFSGLCGHGKE